jgi:hypothetical protein
VSEYYGETIDIPPEEAHDRLSEELGYVTPNIGVKAAIF